MIGAATSPFKTKAYRRDAEIAEQKQEAAWESSMGSERLCEGNKRFYVPIVAREYVNSICEIQF